MRAVCLREEEYLASALFVSCTWAPSPLVMNERIRPAARRVSVAGHWLALSVPVGVSNADWDYDSGRSALGELASSRRGIDAVAVCSAWLRNYGVASRWIGRWMRCFDGVWDEGAKLMLRDARCSELVVSRAKHARDQPQVGRDSWTLVAFGEILTTINQTRTPVDPIDSQSQLQAIHTTETNVIPSGTTET